MSDLTKWIDTIPDAAHYDDDSDPHELTDEDYAELRAEMLAASVAPVSSNNENPARAAKRGRTRTFSDDDLKRLAAEGLPTSDIASKLGVSWQGIRNRADRLGLTIKHGVSGRSSILLPHEAEIRKRLAQRETIDVIAASLSISRNTLDKFIRRQRLRPNA